MIRRPAVAGKFYPGSNNALKITVEEYLNHKVTPKKVMGVAAPHAGYVYSGKTAGKTFASTIIPEKCIILAPNHSGLGAQAAIMTEGEWATPIDNIPVAHELAKNLLNRTPVLQDDVTAHVPEHSLEVQLPFMQFKQPLLSIVPICLQRLRLESCIELGNAIADAIKDSGEGILIVASTDMNHYEDQERTKRKDEMAIEKVLALDPEGLISVCRENGISMCGVYPVAVMLMACKALGATKAELVEHTTSGEVSGDFDAVVGYAGFLVY